MNIILATLFDKPLKPIYIPITVGILSLINGTNYFVTEMGEFMALFIIAIALNYYILTDEKTPQTDPCV